VKPLIQKLPLPEQCSFVAKTYTTPLFETRWHQHCEFELVLQIKGKGMCFIGNYIGDFKEGDIFLLGSNLPHEFKKEHDAKENSAMVVHFDKDFWGKNFWYIPECKEITQLLDQSMLGIKLNGPNYPALATAILRLETASGFERIALLCQCLLLLSREHTETLSTLQLNDLAVFSDHKINRVFEYSINEFQNPIALSTVASIVNMSISAFCRYFKRNTKKTYIAFINEMRIGHACHALVNSDKTIVHIAYESGFGTIANFNKQFLKVKGLKPSVYKKRFKV
jgi:AraC-like DNA-binding protein